MWLDVVWGAESMIDNHPQSILVNETRSSVVDFDQKETWATPCDYPELGVGDKDLTWVRPAWTEQIISRDFIKESRVDSSSWRCLWICTVDRTFLDNGLQVDGGFFFFKDADWKFWWRTGLCPRKTPLILPVAALCINSHQTSYSQSAFSDDLRQLSVISQTNCYPLHPTTQ